MKRVAKAATFMMCASALVLLVAGNAAAQKPPKCTPDVPLKVTITSGTDGVLFGDSKGGGYTNGVDGVANTVIHRCSGSNDATMGLMGSRRSMGFSFSGDIAGSLTGGSWPSWTAEQFLTKPFLNVRNVLWGRLGGVGAAADGSYTFKTRMSIGYIKGPGDRADYVLRFMPDINPPEGPSAILPDPFIDELTVPVTVVDRPATCTWTVTVDPDFVGVLYRTSTDEQAGRFTMPFQLELKAKTCPF